MPHKEAMRAARQSMWCTYHDNDGSGVYMTDKHEYRYLLDRVMTKQTTFVCYEGTNTHYWEKFESQPRIPWLLFEPAHNLKHILILECKELDFRDLYLLKTACPHLELIEQQWDKRREVPFHGMQPYVQKCTWKFVEWQCFEFQRRKHWHPHFEKTESAVYFNLHEA